MLFGSAVVAQNDPYRDGLSGHHNGLSSREGREPSTDPDLTSFGVDEDHDDQKRSVDEMTLVESHDESRRHGPQFDLDSTPASDEV